MPPFGLRLLKGAGLAVLIALASASPSSFAAGEPGVPAWLEAHVGEGEGQIAPVVLERARALYQRKGVRNPCYFAFDATRPHDLGGGLGRRFYIICEAQESFRAISAGHGGGRDLDGLADFSNGRRCVKNFGNAMDSDLTTGGDYVTADIAAAFKGYYRAGGGDAAFTRPFLKFDGEGDTANAQRARDRRTSGGPAQGSLSSKGPAKPARRRGWLRSVRQARELRSRAQRRLHQLVALGRREHHGDGAEQSDHPLHLSGVARHRGGRARGSRRRDAVARRALLERRVPQRHRRAEVLAEGNARADHCAMARGASRSAARAAADLQGVSASRERGKR